MPAIAAIGSSIKVIPGDDVQIVRGNDELEFAPDRSPFALTVEGVLREGVKAIGVYGPVVRGHVRYGGLIATLFVRLDGSNWLRDTRSQAAFKVGKTIAKPNGQHPFWHPEGSTIEGHPFYIRFGSVDSTSDGEEAINSAMGAFRQNR